MLKPFTHRKDAIGAKLKNVQMKKCYQAFNCYPVRNPSFAIIGFSLRPLRLCGERFSIRIYCFFSASISTSRTRSARFTATWSTGFCALVSGRLRMVSAIAAMIATSRITEAISKG